MSEARLTDQDLLLLMSWLTAHGQSMVVEAGGAPPQNYPCKLCFHPWVSLAVCCFAGSSLCRLWLCPVHRAGFVGHQNETGESACSGDLRLTEFYLGSDYRMDEAVLTLTSDCHLN